MDAIDLNSKPRLSVYFDPNNWQANNPMKHPEIYQLNQAQLQGWAVDVTEIRRKIVKKAENYERYTTTTKKSSAKANSRRSIPHSKPEDNPEGLLEIQI